MPSRLLLEYRRFNAVDLALSAMYERFTDRARKVMRLANDEAERSGSMSITSEYLLFGLLKEGSGVAAYSLRRLGIDLAALEAALATSIAAEAALQPAVEAKPDRPKPPFSVIRSLFRWSNKRRLPPRSETKRIVEHAMREARALRHNYVGTEHLLLGLLDEPECAAAKVLLIPGLNCDEVRREILSVLGASRSLPKI
ncbi:MAG: Clp protease N-terminal domain-containing protein [Pirellulales bacterium]